jgi:hypothetical protein
MMGKNKRIGKNDLSRYFINCKLGVCNIVVSQAVNYAIAIYLHCKHCFCSLKGKALQLEAWMNIKRQHLDGLEELPLPNFFTTE